MRKTLPLLVMFVLFPALACAYQSLTVPHYMEWDSAGDPLTGGKVNTYECATTTRKATYSDKLLTVVNTNPIILDSSGRSGMIYFEDCVKIVVTNSADVMQYTRDFLYGQGSTIMHFTMLSDYAGTADTGTTTSVGASGLVMTDSGASFATNEFTGQTITNVTDGSTCTVTSNNGTTITCTVALTGGTEDDWDSADAYSVTNTGRLTAAIASISTAETDLWVDVNDSVVANTTVPITLRLRFMKGAELTIATTKTLSIDGPFDAGLQKIFIETGSGAVVMGGGVVEEILPEWWGAIGDGDSGNAATNIAAIQDAINCAEAGITLDGNNLPVDGGRTIKLGSGTYCVNDTIDISDSFVRFEGVGPAKSVIKSTASGPIVTIGDDGAGTFGTTVAYMMLQGDGANTTRGLDIHKVQFFGMAFEKLAIVDVLTTYIYINDAWNGLAFRDIFIHDREHPSTSVQYGFYVQDNTNNIQFADIYVQGLSNNCDDTYGFYLERVDNSSIRNAIIKNVIYAIYIYGAFVGMTIDGVYGEPATDQIAYPSNWSFIKIHGEDATKPVSDVVIKNSKCGWTHGAVDEDGPFTVWLFDLDFVQNLRIESGHYKVHQVGGITATYHFKTTSDVSQVYLSNAVIWDTPTMLGYTDHGDPVVSGTLDPFYVDRLSLELPAMSIYTDDDTATKTVIGSSNAKNTAVVEYQEGSTNDAYSWVTFPIPSNWSESPNTKYYLRLIYTSDTPTITGEEYSFCVGCQAVSTKPESSPSGWESMDVDVEATCKTIAQPTAAFYVVDKTDTTWGAEAPPRHGFIRCMMYRNSDAPADTSDNSMHVISVQLWQRYTQVNQDGTTENW